MSGGTKKRPHGAPGLYQRHFARIVQLLVMRPRSISGLRHALGMKETSQSLYRVVRALRDSGLLYIDHWERTRGPSVPVYGWQPSVREYEDAEKPDLEFWRKCSDSRQSSHGAQA